MEIDNTRLAGDVQLVILMFDMTERVLRNTRKKDNDFTPPVYIWGVKYTDK